MTQYTTYFRLYMPLSVPSTNEVRNSVQLSSFEYLVRKRVERESERSKSDRENGRDEQLFSLEEMGCCYRLLHHHSSRHNRREWRVHVLTNTTVFSYFLSFVVFFKFYLIFIYKRDIDTHTHQRLCVCASMSLLRDQQHVKT